jgi:hypothetical protein
MYSKLGELATRFSLVPRNSLFSLYSTLKVSRLLSILK